jgi:hypothetical protein
VGFISAVAEFFQEDKHLETAHRYGVSFQNTCIHPAPGSNLGGSYRLRDSSMNTRLSADWYPRLFSFRRARSPRTYRPAYLFSGGLEARVPKPRVPIARFDGGCTPYPAGRLLKNDSFRGFRKSKSGEKQKMDTTMVSTILVGDHDVL